jgi:hypothetical protein
LRDIHRRRRKPHLERALVFALDGVAAGSRSHPHCKRHASVAFLNLHFLSPLSPTLSFPPALRGHFIGVCSRKISGAETPVFFYNFLLAEAIYRPEIESGT